MKRKRRGVSTNEGRTRKWIVEKNKSRTRVEKSRERRHVEYSTIDYKVATAFIIIIEMCKREGV
jgi:hypothetical protein